MLTLPRCGSVAVNIQLSVIVMDPVRVPVAVGVNFTLIVHVPKAPSFWAEPGFRPSRCPLAALLLALSLTCAQHAYKQPTVRMYGFIQIYGYLVFPSFGFTKSLQKRTKAYKSIAREETN